ncbi:hypothetical protein V1520DRAFT_79946 [Lipomyces starkeyi]|uniref:Replication protein A C-terminal domain-containing protein n=1 Tax=Lipomyces starkeyi NRRL Y-11557 TaxID=675824 RepID=A0A1E3QBY3_LIPST|nr:hypothetical protein LIPSTDRAFT_62006 [Lipomyces starkeyi NRRL Y-11557]
MSYDTSYNSNYGGGFGGGGGGGGFVSNNYGSDGMSNSQGGGDRSISESKSRVRPVTIKQILDASQAHPDSEYSVDGVDVSTVTFVGMVRNVLNQTTNSTYRIEDGTGTIEVRKFVSADRPDSDRIQGPQMGDYVRVIGELKAFFNNKRQVNGNLIRKVTDYNEVIYAQLEALALHLQTVHPERQGGAGGVHEETKMTGIQPSTRSYTNENLTSLQRKVLDTLSTAAEQASNEGVNIHVIAQRVGANPNTIQEACEYLSELGLIYTTIDYDHYKLT